jgi:hypothetical protein
LSLSRLTSEPEIDQAISIITVAVSRMRALAQKTNAAPKDGVLAL